MENNSKKPFSRLVSALDSFFNDDTTYYAASLSFFTIFSILPILKYEVQKANNIKIKIEKNKIFLKLLIIQNIEKIKIVHKKNDVLPPDK